MKALVVHGAGDLRIDDLPWASPEPGQVLVRNTHGGICGSDLHYYRHGAVGAFALREPLVLGHEVVGRVELDPTGTLPKTTPVAIHPASPCGHCPECVSRDTQCLPQHALFRVGGELPSHPRGILRVHGGPPGSGPGVADDPSAVPRGAGRAAGRRVARPEQGRRRSRSEGIGQRVGTDRDSGRRRSENCWCRGSLDYRRTRATVEDRIGRGCGPHRAHRCRRLAGSVFRCGHRSIRRLGRHRSHPGGGASPRSHGAAGYVPARAAPRRTVGVGGQGDRSARSLPVRHRVRRIHRPARGKRRPGPGHYP